MLTEEGMHLVKNLIPTNFWENYIYSQLVFNSHMSTASLSIELQWSWIYLLSIRAWCGNWFWVNQIIPSGCATTLTYDLPSNHHRIWEEIKKESRRKSQETKKEEAETKKNKKKEEFKLKGCEF